MASLDKETYDYMRFGSILTIKEYLDWEKQKIKLKKEREDEKSTRLD